MSEWIKCSDRLPDKEVLCVNVKNDYLIGYVTDVDGYYIAENNHELLPKVIAWMPLPEPPKD